MLRIKESVDHQNIAGGEFIKEFLVSADEIDRRAMSGNPACLNFVSRRPDFLPGFNKKCYYGKVKKVGEKNDFLFGYVVCEDELEEV